MLRAEYKPFQLKTAREAGLIIPPTLITNEPAAVREFAAEVGSDLVCEPVASPVFIEGGELKTVYTRRIGPGDLADLQGIDLTCHLFQAWADKDHEVRLTVVGDRLFAAAIHTDSPAGHVDWRSDYNALTYTVTTVPKPVASGVRQLMDRLRLRYGALDFVVSPNGTWTLLEINPSGQWDWIEHETKLPLTDAIANELQGIT
ncbi:hypothetical protein ACFV0R_07465 [Streptomyces sp. NPDC059578]|uniref:hypothetical protein n=1 Tax=Streptomyces sp. NPDC059578 TaxID=3346874 RepID=UPI0036BAEE39